MRPGRRQRAHSKARPQWPYARGEKWRCRSRGFFLWPCVACRLSLAVCRLPLAHLWLLACLGTLPVSLWNGADRRNSVGEGGGGWNGGREDAAFAGWSCWSGVEIESRAAAARLRFGTRPPRCTQAPVLLVLKASINLSLVYVHCTALICGGLDRCSCGEGPLVERSRLGSACMLCTIPALGQALGRPGGRGDQVGR